MRNHKCGCRGRGCSTCCPPKKKNDCPPVCPTGPEGPEGPQGIPGPGPIIPSCACAKAFDDDFIRELMHLVELGVTELGGLAGAQAYAALFCATGCTIGNLGAPPPVGALLTCTPGNILTASQGAQAFIYSLTFDHLVITRTVNPDCSMEVAVFRNADVRFVGDVNTPVLSYGVTQFVIDPSCCLRFQSFIDLRPQ